MLRKTTELPEMSKGPYLVAGKSHLYLSQINRLFRSFELFMIKTLLLLVAVTIVN